MDLTCLSVLFCISHHKCEEGCAEGASDVLHDLGKGHGFVYARNGEREVLHHGAHHAILVRCLKKKIIVDTGKLKSASLEHVKN